MAKETNVTVRPVAPGDRDARSELYQDYAAFYAVDQTEEMRRRVWEWLHDLAAECEGLVAEGPDGILLGLAHFRPLSRLLAASTGGFLDDLFVAPVARSSGVANALVGGVRKIAAERGWSVVRWITAEDNYRARGLYDRLANKTKWITYDLKL